MKCCRHLFLFVILTTFGCNTLFKANKQPLPTPIEASPDFSTLYIKANNLSEDLSRLATNNDELILLLYTPTEEDDLTELLFSSSFVLDTLQLSKAFQMEKIPSDFDQNILIYLLEIDTDKTIGDIEPIIRANHKTITDAFSNRDTETWTALFGDDDLLGIKKISASQLRTQKQFLIEGIQKLDRFEYLIQIEL